MVEQVQDAIVLMLKGIGKASGDWFTKPQTVTINYTADLWKKPRPCLVVVPQTTEISAEVSERYQSESEFDIWCICKAGARDTGMQNLYRLMSDVQKMLAENYRPSSGVLDSGHMFITGSSVEMAHSLAENCLVGKVTVKCLYSWSATAP